MKKGWGSDEFVYHWKYYTCPSRASPSDLEFMKRLIQKKGKKAKVLILGATPEYRNICGELKIPATMIDWKKMNVDYLKAEVKNLPQKETFIEGNWLNIKLNEKFDVILGDNVLNIFSKKEVPKLLKNISLMLDKDGVFLARTFVKKKNEKFSLTMINKRHKLNHKYGIYPSYVHHFYYLFYNNKKDCIIWHECYEKTKKLFEKGLISKEAMDYCDKLSWENRDFRVYFPLKEKLNMTISKSFKIVEIFYGKEPYLENRCPLYVLKVKK